MKYFPGLAPSHELNQIGRCSSQVSAAPKPYGEEDDDDVIEDDPDDVDEEEEDEDLEEDDE